MKRTFRVAIIFIFVAVLLAGIGLWRNHYLKIMKAEPKIVYHSKPLQPNNLRTDANTPKVTPVKGDDKTDVTDIEPNITTQPIDNSITPEEMDNTSNSPAGTIFGDIVEQNLPPEAAAALKQYEEAQSALPGLNDELRPLLKASPLDMDAIRLVNEKKKKIRQQRMDALEILALYSDGAFNELQATIEREKEAERIVNELDGGFSASLKARSASRKERAAKVKRLIDVAEGLEKSIPTSSKELEQAKEELEQASE